MAARTEDIAQTIGMGRRKRRLVPWIGGGIILALALGGAAFWLNRQAGTAAVSYTTLPVGRGDITVTVTATGTVEPTTQVAISSELSGRVEKVLVDYNDQVEVGQVLAMLDTTKLAAQQENAEASLQSAEARLLQAQASLREAEENFRTAEALDKRGVTSRQSFISVAAAHDRAKADVEIAEADRTLAKANLALRQADVENAAIRSPVKGVVLLRDVNEGQIVASSLNAPTLFQIAEDLSKMQLLVDIDEADVGRVSIGDNATFTVEAHAQKFPARIASVRYLAETTDGVVTYKAVLSLDNSELLLRPGMTATAEIMVSEEKGALVVPNAALRYSPPREQQGAQSQGSSGRGLVGMVMPRRPGGNAPVSAPAGRSVWVLRDGTPVPVAVTTGASDGRNTIITSGDLKEGDRVITRQGSTG